MIMIIIIRTKFIPLAFADIFYPDGPATVEHTHQNAGTTPDQFVF